MKAGKLTSRIYSASFSKHHNVLWDRYLGWNEDRAEVDGVLEANEPLPIALPHHQIRMHASRLLTTFHVLQNWLYWRTLPWRVLAAYQEVQEWWAQATTRIDAEHYEPHLPKITSHYEVIPVYDPTPGARVGSVEEVWITLSTAVCVTLKTSRQYDDRGSQ